MADTKLQAGQNDSLWGIAQTCEIPGGGSNWRALSVERAGTTYDLATQNLPGGLQPGDTVIVPDELEHSCQGEVDNIAGALGGAPQAASEQAANAQTAAGAQTSSAVSATATCSTKIIFVLDPGHGGRGAKASFASAAQIKPYNDKLAAGTITQAEYDAMFDVRSSSWNNALGAVSNTLEKTMTHKLIPLVRDKINEMKGDIIATLPSLENIEVHLTKEDEYVNLTGADRAGVARDKSADFFFCCHFNADRNLDTDPHVRLDITHVSGIVDAKLGVSISSIDNELLGGTYEKSASSSSGSRGPLILYSGHANSPAETVVNARIVGTAIRTHLAAALQNAEGSEETIIEQGEDARRLANISPVNLGTTNADNKQIVPIYLEADFINVESGDRLWNTGGYDADIQASRTRWGIPAEPSDPTAKAAWKEVHIMRDMPNLPEDHDMFDKAATSIAISLLMNLNQRIC